MPEQTRPPHLTPAPPPPKGQAWRQIIVDVPTDHPPANYQWRVQLKDDMFSFWADSVEVTESGALIAWRKRKDESNREVSAVIYAFAAGQWLFCLPLSCLDGTEHVIQWWSRWLTA
jgi:hypothetical protein